MIDFYEALGKKYPIISIKTLSAKRLGRMEKTDRPARRKVELVGDDIFVTNTKIFAEGIQKGIGDSILIKVNQIGSSAGTVAAVQMAYKAGYTAVIVAPAARPPIPSSPTLQSL